MCAALGENNPQNPKKDHTLRGNRTKTDPKKNGPGLFVTNAVTRFEQDENGSAVVDDSDVKLARRFSQENKK